MTALRSLTYAVAIGVAALVAGCATPERGTTPSGAVRPPASSASLEDEHRRLSRLFAGTPVAVELQGESRLRVGVPLKYAFDPGKSVVKPPLGAVLDNIAKGLRQLEGTEVQISAPPDTSGGTRLAGERAASARDYLVGKGVAAQRFGALARGAGEGLEIVLSETR